MSNLPVLIRRLNANLPHLFKRRVVYPFVGLAVGPPTRQWQKKKRTTKQYGTSRECSFSEMHGQYYKRSQLFLRSERVVARSEGIRSSSSQKRPQIVRLLPFPFALLWVRIVAQEDSVEGSRYEGHSSHHMVGPRWALFIDRCQSMGSPVAASSRRAGFASRAESPRSAGPAFSALPGSLIQRFSTSRPGRCVPFV